MDSSYITSAVNPQGYPEHNFPEFAFVGKSNCGKSSLLNSLLQRKNLAKHSSTPGRTQMINFFLVKVSQDDSFVLADLPGYGYSKTSKSIKANWDKMLDSYLTSRKLSCVLFLFDIRRKIEDYEIEYMKSFHEKGTEILIVLTKTDKVKANELRKKKQEILQNLAKYNIEKDKVIPCSTIKKVGIEDLRKKLFTSLS